MSVSSINGARRLIAVIGAMVIALALGACAEEKTTTEKGTTTVASVTEEDADHLPGDHDEEGEHGEDGVAEQDFLSPPFEGEALEIATAYATFFDGSITDNAVHLAAVESGDDPAVIAAFETAWVANAAIAATASASVSRIRMGADGTTATMEFVFLLDGQAQAIIPETAAAVKIDGVWKITRTHFCDVMALAEYSLDLCMGT